MGLISKGFLLSQRVTCCNSTRKGVPMKKFVTTALALMSLSAFGDSHHYRSHFREKQKMEENRSPSSQDESLSMFEFNADSVLGGYFSLDQSKTRGSSVDNDIELNLNLNYAYQLMSQQRLQLGWRLDYLKDTNSSGDMENWGLQIGAIYNQSTDLQNTMYTSLYLGMGWDHTYGASSGGNSSNENMISTLAVGRRYSMDKMGLKHLTYSPEVAFQNRNATTGGALEYSQSLQFRFLQFSVFF